MNGRASPTRRGAAYLIALLAGTIVTITGLSALSMATSRSKETILTDQAARARLLAQSSFEHGLGALSAHFDDGQTRASLESSFTKSITLSDGQLEWSLTEIDGSPLDNADGPIVVRGKATYGQAVHIVEGILPPSGDPYDVLATGLYAGGELRMGANSTLTSDAVVGAIGDVHGSSSNINTDVESAGSISGSHYSMSTTEDAPARRMPEDTLFDYYAALGDTINVDLLPTFLGSPVIQNVLLSPNSNPYGDTNELGIYVLDCSGGRRFVLQNVRIRGTLVLLDSDEANVIIGAGVFMKPAYDWMPTLLVRGGVTFMGTNTGPNESILGVNLNPPHTPYQFEGDADTADAYPARIEGVSYASGNVTFALARQNFKGTMIVGGDARINGFVPVNITYDPGVAHLPPYGFFDDTDGELALDPSTIVWELP
ncbi:MAG: hypothetical protein RIE77_04845 [Phycisphaerales bacterium]|jgi:hypothetical protein